MNRGAGPIPVIGIAGWKKSGKTTLVVRLIEEFTRRGLRVAFTALSSLRKCIVSPWQQAMVERFGGLQ